MHATTYELGGPRVYSYEELLRVIAREASLKPMLVPIPFAAWRTLAWFAEMLPSAPVRGAVGAAVCTRELRFSSTEISGSALATWSTSSARPPPISGASESCCQSENIISSSWGPAFRGKRASCGRRWFRVIF